MGGKTVVMISLAMAIYPRLSILHPRGNIVPEFLGNSNYVIVRKEMCECVINGKVVGRFL